MQLFLEGQTTPTTTAFRAASKAVEDGFVVPPSDL